MQTSVHVVSVNQRSISHLKEYTRTIPRWHYDSIDSRHRHVGGPAQREAQGLTHFQCIPYHVATPCTGSTEEKQKQKQDNFN